MSKYTIFSYLEGSKKLIFIAEYDNLPDAISRYLSFGEDPLSFLYNGKTQRVMSRDVIEAYANTHHIPRNADDMYEGI